MEIDFPSSEAILNLFEEVHGHADVNSFRTDDQLIFLLARKQVTIHSSIRATELRARYNDQILQNS